MFLQVFFSSMVLVPRYIKQLIVLTLDIIFCIFSTWLAFYMRLGEFVNFSNVVLISIIVSICIAIPTFTIFGFYRAIFRYSGGQSLTAMFQAMCIYSLAYGTIFTVIGVEGVPRTLGLIQPLLLMLLVGASRRASQVWLSNKYLDIETRVSRNRVLIYGAGKTGRQLLDVLNNSFEIQVIGFLDDDNHLCGLTVNGKRVYSPGDLVNLVSKLKIAEILLAMPNISRKRHYDILNSVQFAHVVVRTVPNLMDLAQGKVGLNNLRELNADELLGREPVVANHDFLVMNVFDKVVMVTGAGGSIGSELSRQVLSIRPSKLLLIEQNEYALYIINQELEEKCSSLNIDIVPLLASVQDSGRISKILSTWKPDTIYHAAAYKHVPLVEHNLVDGIYNNVFSTLRLAQAAINYGVSNFVFISTDKAVRPTNIMGASKRLAEIVLQAIAANYLTTKFSIVRFGNVLDSSGSVVPRFRQQIRNGGPITLTHSNITRYFMTIPEAAQLVIQAGAMSESGDVFVLDMGRPVKIIDLAKRMIELSGLTVKDGQNPDGDIEIQIIGLRPGEKLYEELLISNNPRPTSHLRIMKANEEFVPWIKLEVQLSRLDEKLKMNDIRAVRLMMKELVAGYIPADQIVDWVYQEQEANL